MNPLRISFPSFLSLFCRHKWILPLCAVSFSTGTAPRAEEVGAIRVERDIPYMGSGQSQRMDVYIPADSFPRPRPAVLIIHGGGWAQGSKDGPRERAFAEFIAGQGAVAASISYTLTQYEGAPWRSKKIKGAWPDNIRDCKTALRFLRAEHERFGIDPNRIAVMGGSAGGHLALLTGLTAEHEALNQLGLYTEQSNRVSGIISFYGIPDVRRWGGNNFIDASRQESPETWALASPVEHLSPDSPPILIVHGDADETVDIALSQEFVEILRQKGLPHQFVLVPGGPHSFRLSHGDLDLRPILTRFLQKCFAAPSDTPYPTPAP